MKRGELILILAIILLIFSGIYINNKYSSRELVQTSPPIPPPPKAPIPGADPPKIDKISFSNSVEHGRQDLIVDIREGPGRELPPEDSPNNLPGLFFSPPEELGCNSQEVANLTSSEIVTYLKTHAYLGCTRNFLWDYDNNFLQIYSDENMIAVLKEIENVSYTFDGTNKDNLEELMVFARIGYYHRFYEDELEFNESVKQAVTNASNVFNNNSNINNSATETAKILGHWLILINSARVHGLYFETLKQVLKDFESDPSRHLDYYHRNNVDTVFYYLQIASIYAGLIDEEMVGLLRNYSINLDLAQSYTFIVDNAIWSLGNLLTLNEHRDLILEALTLSLDTHERLSRPYIWTVKALDFYNNCQTSRPGESICISNVAPDLEALLFPNTYIFDDGAFVVRTPLSINKIQELYHASKQVRSQFSRISETLLPIQGDTNKVLTAIVYGSRADYDHYHSFLFNLDTDNGGIYIEEDGTFYTYERTPQESIYSLEELFRHEYVHYLVSRFIIEGGWGEKEIYANNRIVWFNEGLAEFLAWSTPSEGVKIRKLMVQRIQDDGVDRLTINQTLSSSYNNFKFYRYAGLFFNYLYINEKDTIRKLIQHVNANDITAYDNLIKDLSSNPNLEIAYQSFLDSLIANISSLDNLFTTFPDINQLDAGDFNLIQEAFASTELGNNAKCSVAAYYTNSRFSCRGILYSQQINLNDAWINFDNNLNEIINELNTNNLNNFEGQNCQFGPIRYIRYTNTSSNYYATDYFCEGPLAKINSPQPNQLEQLNLDFLNTGQGVNANCSLVYNTPKCQLSMSSTSYDLSVDNDVLSAELNNQLIEIQNQVYTSRPYYYSDFYCTSIDNNNLIINGSTKYMTKNIACSEEGYHTLLDPVVQITLDFNTTRIGKNSICDYVTPNHIRCQDTMSTTSYDNSINNSVLQQDLEEDAILLQNDVFNIRPSYYTGLSCNLTGEIRIVPSGSERKYAIQDVECNILFSSECGNGILDESEICDSDSISCTENYYSGSATCLNDCSGYDSCIVTDFCGDGIITGNETCDNNAAYCKEFGFNGTRQCASDCSAYDACYLTEFLDQFISDFQSTRLGKYATCEYLTPNHIGCSNSVGTYLHNISTNDSILQKKIEDNIILMRNNIYNIRPNYYSGLSCNVTGEMTVFYREDGKYAYQDVRCNLLFSLENSTNVQCGNSIIEPNEACDTNSRNCTVGNYKGIESCTTNCSGFGSCISNEYCGDSIINGIEECDDSNNQSNDGCSSQCQIEKPFIEVISPEAREYRNEIVPLKFNSLFANNCWYELDSIKYESDCNKDDILNVTPSQHNISEFHKVTIFANNSKGIVNNSKQFTVIHDRKKIIRYSKFHNKGNTTNLNNLNDTDLENTTLILDDEKNGILEFTEGINLTRDSLDIDTNINISHARIEVNSTALPELNKSASLIFRNITFEDPQINRDGQLCEYCEIKEFNSTTDTLEVNVPGFSVYEIIEGASPPPSTGNNNGGGGGGGGGGSGGGPSIEKTDTLQEDDPQINTSIPGGHELSDSGSIKDDEDTINKITQEKERTNSIIIILFIILLVCIGIIWNYMKYYKNNL
jgi:microbial collagenase